MRSEALFINGVFKGVLEEILIIQEALPEQILFLQPYTSSAITHLRDDPPTVDDPMHFFVSITTDLPTIRYEAEIVGWDDKTTLSKERRHAISRITWTLQPGEGGLYDASRVEGAPSVNLLHIRRLKRLTEPFGVEQLVKTSDSQPLSPGRATAGGWAYVRVPSP